MVLAPCSARMPYLFIDDGHPESRDFADNYVWFDAEDAESIARAQEIAAQVAQLRGSPVGDFSVVATGSPSGEAVVEIP